MVSGRAAGTHPSAKTSECLEKGSLSSSVSGESWRMISGARWHNQPFWIRSLFPLLPKHGDKTVGTTGQASPPAAPSLCSLSLFTPGFPQGILARPGFNPTGINASRHGGFVPVPARWQGTTWAGTLLFHGPRCDHCAKMPRKSRVKHYLG